MVAPDTARRLVGPHNGRAAHLGRASDAPRTHLGRASGMPSVKTFQYETVSY